MTSIPRQRLVLVVALVVAALVIAGVGSVITSMNRSGHDDPRASENPKDPPVPVDPIAGETVSTQDLITEVLPNTSTTSPVLRLPPLPMQQGQVMYLRAQMSGRSNIVRTPMFGIRVICLGPGGGAGSIWTVQNHLGQTFGVNTERLRWLFRAPNTTSYTCTMHGVSTTVVDPTVAEFTIDARTTILSATPVTPISTQWFEDIDTCVGAVPIPQIPRCSVARPSVTVLEQTVPTRGARFANLLGDVQLTREYGAFPGGVSTVEVAVRATPVDSGGQGCAPTRTITGRQAITNDLHHIKVTLNLLDVPLNQSPSCGRSLRVDATVTHLAGNPVTIDGPRYSIGIALLR
ncbi:hypothetical protein [Actinopolymorpha pittospori]|uniref:Uncharacterized protein n=1 Tax=Actinopolymorpha pittospori TaxID=648752 RepID=A0A927RF00_9ACTN|nr:hypothetical protein [Actinopolymorpha pittospori]MBE1609705.1 hypothetical protein [Actinopolymorpha pittospori]